MRVCVGAIRRAAVSVVLSFLLPGTASAVGASDAVGVFVAKSGNDSNPGTQAAPKASISAALITAVGNGRPYVFVQAGTYNESINLPSNVSLYGGFDAAWQRSPANITTIAGAASGAVNAVSLGGTTIVDGFTVTTSAGTPDVMAVRVINSPNVILRFNTIQPGTPAVAANGLSGATGANGGQGQNGANGGSATSAGGGGGAGGISTCGRGGGGGGIGGWNSSSGTSGAFGVGNTVGGTGGTSGGCTSPAGSRGGTGGNGSSGGIGSSGAGGAPSTVVAGTWFTPSGASGGTGVFGNSGGGGGGGGGGLASAVCMADRGGGGGGGGAAGCGGTGGQGGHAGGSSFAVFSIGNVGMFGNTVVQTAGTDGGSGGPGGGGGSGGSGGAGGASGDDGQPGGNGGNGGNGGQGGGGGGGTGGSSFGVFNSGGIIGQALNVFQGANVAGSGGAGGAPNGSAGAQGQHGAFVGVEQPITQVPLTVTKAGSGAGTVIADEGFLLCGSTCTQGYMQGMSVTLSAVPVSGFIFTGWTGDCSGTSTCTLAMTAAKAVIATFAPPSSGGLSGASMDFGGQSMGTTSPPQGLVVSNTGGIPMSIGPITITETVAGAQVASSQFAQANDCGSTLAAGASCTIEVTFTPSAVAAAPLNAEIGVTGTLSFATDGVAAGALSASLSGVAEKSLVTHYYRSILRRAPDAGGKTFWSGEAARVAGLGANVNETWFALAMTFYSSPEYLALDRDDGSYVTDLYNTFFNRTPDAAGLTYWTGQLAAGMPREVVLAAFMFSDEFKAFTQGIFGNTSVRPEIDMVMDFYRGLLSRLPDDGGFNFWLHQFRTAQCQGAPQVTAQVEAISSAFATSTEYQQRNRNDPQYVGDLYNGFLRRGGDLGGVQYWIFQVSTSAQTREQERRAFVASPEFNARVVSVVTAGCTL
jgi:hypothetical protein